MRNEYYDSRSQDQFPVDDDQDGRFENLDGAGDQLDSVQHVIPMEEEVGIDPGHGGREVSGGRSGAEETGDDSDDDDSDSGDDSDSDDDQTDESDAPDPSKDKAYRWNAGAGSTDDDDDSDPSARFQAEHANIDPDTLSSAATAHLSSADPGHFQDSVQQGLDNIGDHQVGGLAGAVLSALRQSGLPVDQVVQAAGLSSAAPHEMDKGDLSSLLQYAQQYAPGALGQALTNQPALGQVMGSPILKGILGKIFG